MLSLTLAAFGASPALAPAQVQADFDGDGNADLAIGAPGEDVGSVADAGAVNIIYGGAAGLTSTGAQQFRQEQAGGVSEVGDFCGVAVGKGG